MDTIRILCIDDEQNVLKSLKRVLEKGGYKVFTAEKPKDALTILENELCQVALVDFKMPEMDGIELISLFKELGYPVVPIILTAFGDIKLVVQSMKAGAFDYLTKPWDIDLLMASIDKAVEHYSLLRENRMLRASSLAYAGLGNLIGSSPQMLRIYEVIEKAGNSASHVLISGESGTGKEMIAQAIHSTGSRKDEPFIPVDCSALNPNVIESELFGHVKGAFTGAHQAKEGLFKSAGKGTLFLDEIAEIPHNIQVKLLRALQEMEIKPVGSNSTVKIHARIIAATNKSLPDAINNGEFREDLFYRLNVISIYVPPLREHKEDIPQLVSHFIRKYTSDRREVTGIKPDALSTLIAYHWPGNIRQLENMIERAYTMGTGEMISAADFSTEIRSSQPEDIAIQSLKDVERQHIINAILHCKGNKREAARLLGIGKSTLYNRISEYKISL